MSLAAHRHSPPRTAHRAPHTAHRSLFFTTTPYQELGQLKEQLKRLDKENTNTARNAAHSSAHGGEDLRRRTAELTEACARAEARVRIFDEEQVAGSREQGAGNREQGASSECRSEEGCKVGQIAH
jgi:hypothetical protein